MASIDGRLHVCDCCALVLTNGDDSGCSGFWNHDHQPASLLPADCHVFGEPEVWEGRRWWHCDGCGDALLSGSQKWPVVIFEGVTL